MKKYKILIIDDRWHNERDQTYTKVLKDDFIIDNVDKASSLYDKIAQDDIDGYLVDVVLSNWTDEKNNPLEVLTVLNYIGKSKPIVLVSSEYKELVDGDKLTDLINKIIDHGYKVNSFLLWNNFITASRDADPNRIKSIQNTLKLNIKRQERISFNKNNKFDLAVIAALSEELVPFIKHLTEAKSEISGKILYTTGYLLTKNGRSIRVVAVHQEDMGTVDTAILGTYLLQQFEVKNIVMIGVCGGRPGRANIGDIVIPNEIVAYQKGKITEAGLLLDVDIAKSSMNAKMLFENKCDKLVQKVFKDFITLGMKQNLQWGTNQPVLLFDEMACGENVLNKEGELDVIASTVNKPKLCAIDMETYGVFRLNTFFAVNTLIVKSVMDLTSSKSDKFKTYAAYMAANFLKLVLYEELLVV